MSSDIIVIDGLDACGKATQVEKLRQYCINKGLVENDDFTTVSFPRYGKESASLVQSYLAGSFGGSPDAVGPRTAAMMYSVDRSISYRTEEWGNVYRNGGLIIADRYVTSNLIHQGSKLLNHCSTPDKSDPRSFQHTHMFRNYMDWLMTTEYIMFNIPVPTITIFLETSEDVNLSMLHNRRSTSEVVGDIHESNTKYLNDCRFTLAAFKDYVSEKNLGNLFKFIKVYDDNGPLSIEQVHGLILNEVHQIIDEQVHFWE